MFLLLAVELAGSIIFAACLTRGLGSNRLPGPCCFQGELQFHPGSRSSTASDYPRI